ncbi:unnamed protein product [Durusdinium trenchii]|uniref:Enoyl-CoA hydratase n=1 Tax=Durusdinium trenchii TaxID=1381693 RepID=A0ABP0PHP6_9DINO
MLTCSHVAAPSSHTFDSKRPESELWEPEEVTNEMDPAETKWAMFVTMFEGPDVIEEAADFALSHPPNPISKREVPKTNRFMVAAGGLEQGLNTAVNAAPLMIAPRSIIKCFDAACSNKSFREGLAVEMEEFTKLVFSVESAALRHLFLSEGLARKVPGIDEKPAPLKKIGILGAGLMGASAAMCFVQKGVPVVLKDAKQEWLDSGMKKIESLWGGQAKRGRLSKDKFKEYMSLLKPTLDYADFKDVDMVIEAVPEIMELKKEVFLDIEKNTKPDALICTNTSGLNIDDIATVLKDPSRVMGCHFFSPANVMQLLENVRTSKSSVRTLATGMAMGKLINKKCVMVGNCDGFVGNRMIAPYAGEAKMVLEEGATIEQIDKAAVAFGMAMGPMALGDLVGQELFWKQRKAAGDMNKQTKTYYGPYELTDWLCEQGRFGMKTPDPKIKARAEQALITAQLRALKGEAAEGDAFSPRHAVGVAGASPVATKRGWTEAELPDAAVGLGSPKANTGAPAAPEELSALRAHVAELDHEIVQREIVIEELQSKLKTTEDALEKALLSPAEGGLWKERYQTAQKENEVRAREVKELKFKMDVKGKEIKLLSQYVRKLEEEARVRDTQRERLLTDAQIARSKFKQTESEQQQLVSRLHGLEDAFARCVGRITGALTAGVVGVCLDEAQPVPRFVVLTAHPAGNGLLEIFEEPDSHWELCAVELSPLGVGKKPPVTLDENTLSLVTCGVLGGGVAPSLASVASPALKCPDKASFMKWSAAFRNLNLLPAYGAVSGEGAASPSSPGRGVASPGGFAFGAFGGASVGVGALEPKDDALTETRLNSLLAAVEGNSSGEQRLEQRLMTRCCVVVLKVHLPEEQKEHLSLLCYLRAYYAVAAWEEGVHWVNSHGSLMHLYCDTAILGLRIALRMQRLAFEFPNWAADGIEKDLENCETTFKISGGMEVGSVIPMRGDLFGEPNAAALQWAAAAPPGQLWLSSGACAAGLEDLELRKLRDAGCIELAQKTEQGGSCISVEVSDSLKLSIPIVRANPPGLEASVEALGGAEAPRSQGSFVVSFYARSVGVESRAYRKPIQTLRLLLKFRDTVRLAVSRAQGEVCWCHGQHLCALFETSEAAVLCADEAQKEMALHNATRKGDVQLGMVCACDFGDVFLNGRDFGGPTLWRAQTLAEAGKLGEILVTSEVLNTEDWTTSAPHVELSATRDCLGATGPEDYIHYSAEVDPEVVAKLDEVRKAKGVVPRAVSDQEICERLFYPLINEGFKILEEGYVARSNDIDIVYIYGYGFPPSKGGPIFFAENYAGFKTILEKLKVFDKQAKERFTKNKAYLPINYFEPSKLLEACAEKEGMKA